MLPTDCPCRGTGEDKRFVVRNGVKGWEVSPCGVCRGEAKRKWIEEQARAEKERKRKQ